MPLDVPVCGRFITFEGIDGCGKTTQLRTFAQWLRDSGRDVVEAVEPGGTAIGREIRRVLLDPASKGMDPRTELLLYFASRAQNVAEVIRPALAAGKIVVCDRFTDSTVVYQGAGRGIDKSVILDLDRIACDGLKPDLTILIGIDVETSIFRARRRNDRTGAAESRIDDESAAFHNRVRQAYAELAAAEPGRFIRIDGNAGISDVGHRIREAITGRV
jgi:dTMP kinase